MEGGVVGLAQETPYFHPRHRHPPPGMILPTTVSVRLNHICTGIRRFRSTGIGCVDHVVLQYPTHRPPRGLHGLAVLDDETIEWLLNTCPKI